MTAEITTTSHRAQVQVGNQLLFFYMGFLAPIVKVAIEFPPVVYQGLVIYLLIAIGWKGGEELAALAEHDPAMLYRALGFMVVGFITNFTIGVAAYATLRAMTNLRRVDAATVGAYYGSDSAGTFATCLGALGIMQATALTSALAVAGVSPSQLGFKEVDLRKVEGGLADTPTLDHWQQEGVSVERVRTAAELSARYREASFMPVMLAVMEIPGCLVGLFLVSRLRRAGMDSLGNMPDEAGYQSSSSFDIAPPPISHSHRRHKKRIAVEEQNGGELKPVSIFSAELLHEVFLNSGIYLLFGGIAVGFVGQLQGQSVVDKDNPVFVTLFHGLLCLYLLEMGMTASRRLGDLHTAGWRFIAFAIIAPNIFATFGMVVAHIYGQLVGVEFSIGTYTVFAVLCAAASYIAVPAIQRLAIPEASPTLPLAASLGLTFSYNVTIGITVYSKIAEALFAYWPITVVHTA
ncbi:MAG TPA: sodium-dependent bicarbonate transport family permease [Pirellulales bacterium]|jgi:hypothetical protein|nr:sodium-dependent bicarbonate transport family permease [Pirellulales bacterium]